MKPNLFSRTLLFVSPSSIFQTLCFANLILLIVFLFRDNYELDFFWHILIGKDILENFRFSGDPAWTWAPADKNWVTTQPLSEVIMYLLWTLGGPILISLLRLVLFLYLMLSIYVHIFRQCNYSLKSGLGKLSLFLLLTTSSTLLLGFIQERPNSITLLLTFFVGREISKILSFPSKPNFLSLFLIFTFWPFLHGGWLLSLFAVLFAFIFRSYIENRVQVKTQDLRIPILLSVWPFLLTLLTPAKSSYFPIALEIAELGRNFITEWQSMFSANDKLSSVVFLVYLIVLVNLLWKYKREEQKLGNYQTVYFRLILSLILAMTAVYSIRNIPLVILLTLPLIYEKRDKVSESVAIRQKELFTLSVRKMNRIPVLGLVAAITWSATQSANALIIDDEKRPLKIYEQLVTLDSNRKFFNSSNEGGELLFFGRGRVKVFLDGRIDRYSIELHEQIWNFLEKGDDLTSFQRRFFSCSTDLLVKNDLPIVSELGKFGFVLQARDGQFSWFSRVVPSKMGACS